MKNSRRRIVLVNGLLQIGFSSALPSSSISASSFDLNNYNQVEGSTARGRWLYRVKETTHMGRKTTTKSQGPAAPNNREVKTYLLVGGPRDGHRLALTDTEVGAWPVTYVSVPRSVEYSEGLGPEAPPPERAKYRREHLRGPAVEVISYRHDSLSCDQALLRLFELYPAETSINGHRKEVA
jgi:hypothetical protein